MRASRVVRIVAAATLVTCVAAGVAMLVPAGVAVTVAGAATAMTVTQAAWQGYRHERIAGALRRNSTVAVVAGTEVRLTPVDNTAFVTGLWRPHIYCSHDLVDRLTGDELRAVTLHERAHQRSRDPLRLVLLASVAPVAALHRRGRAWLERTAAAREIAADRYALEHGATRTALASALLKVEPLPAVGLPGFSSATQLRIRALLAPTSTGEVRAACWPGVALGIAAAVWSCLWMWPPVLEALCCR